MSEGFSDADLQRFREEVSKPLSEKQKTRIEMDYRLPSMIAKGKSEMSNWFVLASFSRSPEQEEKRRQLRSGVLEKVSVALENPVTMFADIGLSYMPQESYFNGKYILDGLTKTKDPLLFMEDVVAVLGKAAEVQPDKKLFTETIEDPKTPEEEWVRLIVFENILNEGGFDLADAFVNSGKDPVNFGDRIAPGIIRAFEVACSIAAKYPHLEEVQKALANQDVYGWASRALEYMPDNKPHTFRDTARLFPAPENFKELFKIYSNALKNMSSEDKIKDKISTDKIKRIINETGMGNRG